MNIQADYKLLGVALIGAIVLYYIAKREVGQAATAVGNALDVTSRENLAARATNALVSSTAGQTSGAQNLGQQIYAWTHPTEWAALNKRVAK